VSAPTIARVVIALRDARAEWLTASHKIVVTMIAARLPDARPSQRRIAEDTGFDRRTIIRVLADLRAHGVLRFDGKRRGKAHSYAINLKSLRALKHKKGVIHDHTHEAPQGVIDDHMGCDPRSHLGVIVDHTKIASEGSNRRDPPSFPSRAASRRAAPPAGPGRGGNQEPGAVQRVVAAYAAGYRHARGVDPTLNGVAHRAAQQLLADVGLEGALTRIEHASRDPWWAQHGDLQSIAARPDRWATEPPPPPPARADLQPMSGKTWPSS